MKEINQIAVLGAGMMGAEIAYCCAAAGCEVLLKDMSQALADSGKKRIIKILGKQVEKGKLAESAKDEIAGRITATDKYAGIENADLVIEAVLEKYEIKSVVFKELSGVIKSDCVVASNTSAISITKLAGNMKYPTNFIGMHFFSPASVMKLVEVIPGLETTEDTVTEAESFCRRIGKEPIRVKECVGFVVNRMLHAMLREAFRLAEEGIADPGDIDKAAKLGLGHPVGPFQLMDLAGNDLALSNFETLFNEYGDRFRPSPLLRQKVFANQLGRKTKKGWFVYE
ncbi:MAG TPA: 3-hydroxyacyl-CoA dehydrogenase family protein [Syntrophales bacterium]|nr:3-hydroxyacyl-CoA dehydrogenase family protein [Syntrophales bacterium]